MINIFVNDIKKKVPKNITVLQACSHLKIEIPKFCFQENLQIAGNCRMCLIEIENSPKPVASCAMPVSPNMKIYTDTPLVRKARESVLEFLLINHPLDCPICDQASECDLQDQTMIYGSDKSRYFFKKRTVEDKNFGPFIKSIMTRCIHCTRCVRFANEIGNIDGLGTTGRGNFTEINFYSPNVFKSEFSGNLIDLCPVGALTSKPLAFKGRVWESKKKEAVDILDAVGSNLEIELVDRSIVKILPRTNDDINKEWISNKTRFFFDSIHYQRIKTPAIKKENGEFQKITWFDAFNILKTKLIHTDASKIKGIVGDLTDLQSLIYFKNLFNSLGVSNIINESFLQKDFFEINSDFTSNFLFNKKMKSIDETDLCLIINSDIREEASILNTHLINRLKKGGFNIYYIGPQINFTYPIKHLGNTIKTLEQIIKGEHPFCNKLKKAKNPMIIVGEQILHKKNLYFLIENFKNLEFLQKDTVNFLNTKSSFINFLEINLHNDKIKNKKADFIYLLNTNLKNNLKINKKENSFIVYQGHHFTQDAQNSNLILPGLTFLEKTGSYINLEGTIQTNEKILNTINNGKDDALILKQLYKYIFLKDNKATHLFKYLSNKQLKIINNISFGKKDVKINNCFLDTFFKTNAHNILEEHSKILVESFKCFKKHNF
uniref:NADH dehydrogenase subunit 11 n=1 Tax=Paralagenidium karlingii TaxID=1440115 RepID=UPI0026E42E1F|nr:NADH dehydrogenase subunit 11 [Paralagenidium karlingii]WJH17938.1 NADH dehydrogenase subunit 11 [Paralagenidium karlingii]